MGSQTFKDLFHVVPATSKAYIYIATAWECKDETGKVEREWGDGIYGVLAYATTRAGWGAYLIDNQREGPTWITARRSEDLFMRVIRQNERPDELRGMCWVERYKVVDGKYDEEVSPLHFDFSDHIDFVFAS
tara:strand:+ start:310 stop:705 length:396 start_codon:yes stop_codon:yes gene_type:complete